MSASTTNLTMATTGASPMSATTPVGSTGSITTSTSTAPGMAAVKQRHALQNRHDPLRNPASNATTIIENLLSAAQTGFILGDSGLGKSPFVYQLGICASAAIPFIGEQSYQTDVLYLDFENSRVQGDDIEERLCQFLNLSQTPNAFTRWHESDCVEKYGTAGYTLDDIIKDWAVASPNPRKLVIADPYRYWRGEIENPKLSDRELQTIRGIARKYKTAILGICHPRRAPSEKNSGSLLNPIETVESNPRNWIMAKSRGSGNLISNSDVRIGFDVCGCSLPNTQDAERRVVGGFRRVQGSVGPIHIDKVLHPVDGEPLGWQRVFVALSAAHESIYAGLPATFKFKDAARVYCKNSARAVDAFLKACQEAGRLRKEAKCYVKI